MKGNFFQTQLQARSQVSLSISQRRIRLSRRTKGVSVLVRENSANRRRAVIPAHVDAFGVMAKVIEIQTKLPVLFSANDFTKLFDESRLPVRSQTHDLPFVAVMWKPEKLRRSRVDDTD